MNWIKNNYKLILKWLVLIAIAPFFIEIIFAAEIMGAEVAFGLLLLILRSLKNNWKRSMYQIKEYCESSLEIVRQQPIFQLNIYLSHVAASVMLLVVGTSFTYLFLLWCPVLLIGTTIS